MANYVRFRTSHYHDHLYVFIMVISLLSALSHRPCYGGYTNLTCASSAQVWLKWVAGGSGGSSGVGVYFSWAWHVIARTKHLLVFEHNHSQMFVYWHVSGRWWRKMLWPRWSSELDIHMMVCIIVQSPTCALPCLLQLKWRTRETSRLQQKIRFTSSAGSGVNVVASLVFLGLRMWFSHTHTSAQWV